MPGQRDVKANTTRNASKSPGAGSASATRIPTVGSRRRVPKPTSPKPRAPGRFSMVAPACGLPCRYFPAASSLAADRRALVRLLFVRTSVWIFCCRQLILFLVYAPQSAFQVVDVVHDAFDKTLAMRSFWPLTVTGVVLRLDHDGGGQAWELRGALLIPLRTTGIAPCQGLTTLLMANSCQLATSEVDCQHI